MFKNGSVNHTVAIIEPDQETEDVRDINIGRYDIPYLFEDYDGLILAACTPTCYERRRPEQNCTEEQLFMWLIEECTGIVSC